MSKELATRAKALAGMNKAELVRTIKALDKRVTKLLNEVAKKDKLLSDTLPSEPRLPVVDLHYAPKMDDWEAAHIRDEAARKLGYVPEAPIDQANPPQDAAGKFPWETET